MNANSRGLLNQCKASRKADREFIARALLEIAAKHGAQVERRDEPGLAGFGCAGIHITFTLNGVGAMLDIDNVHSGSTALIHWYNDYSVKKPVQDYSSRFNVCVGASSSGRPHHKATSLPGDWYSLAMNLDAGLLLAARGEAFQTNAA